MPRAGARSFFFGATLEPHANLQIINDDVRHLTPDHFKDIDAVIDLAAISNDQTGEEFADETRAINWKARAANAKMAKQANVKRYIFPSSCSLYGNQK